MRAGQLPLDEQMTRFRRALGLNQTLGAVLAGAHVRQTKGPGQGMIPSLGR